MKPYSILVISRGKASLGRMFQGYINYFNQGNIHITVSTTDIRTIHPLAIDVMREDGIELDQSLATDYLKNNFNQFDRIFVLGQLSAAAMDNISGQNVEFIPLTDPLSSGTYTGTIAMYQSVREEIKKICIEIVGSHALVNT